MYMDAPNQFLTDSDNGFINVSSWLGKGMTMILTKTKLAYRYDDRCTFDANTGDLTCV
jgi:hypothetical protein